MKNLIFFISSFLAICTLSCIHKTEKRKTYPNEYSNAASVNSGLISQSDLEERDLSVLNANKDRELIFQKQKAQIFFVAGFNVLNYEINNSWTGYPYDCKIFLGYEEEDLVYYIEPYYPLSRKFAEKYKDTTIIVERYFFKYNVATDPRETSWWLCCIVKIIKDDSNLVDLDGFLEEALCLEGSNNKVFKDYAISLKRKILKKEGGNIKQKLINYTSEVVPGVPRDWDAWGPKGD